MFQDPHQSIIYPLPVLTDNIIWIWSYKNEAVVIDPAIDQPVNNWLKAKNLKLKAILQTHHHDDHIGGTRGLLKKWPNTPVYAAASDINRIPFQTHSLKDGDQFILLNKLISVLEVSGHTRTHIAYFITSINNNEILPLLFCGDTLFGGGCGRLFEGTAKNMYLSLQKFSALPNETKVYCAHEYTEANLHWALEICPKDRLIMDRLLKVSKLREKGTPSLPSTIRDEKSTNLFMRAKDSNELRELRIHKDNWSA